MIPVFAVCPLVARWVPEYDDHQNHFTRDCQNQSCMGNDNDGNDDETPLQRVHWKSTLPGWISRSLQATSRAQYGV